jgi:hypothetical protein
MVFANWTLSVERAEMRHYDRSSNGMSNHIFYVLNYSQKTKTQCLEQYTWNGRQHLPSIAACGFTRQPDCIRNSRFTVQKHIDVRHFFFLIWHASAPFYLTYSLLHCISLFFFRWDKKYNVITIATSMQLVTVIFKLFRLVQRNFS